MTAGRSLTKGLRRARAVLCVILGVMACDSGEIGDATPDLETLQLTETLRIGSVDDADPGLTRPGAVLPRPDGSVWLVQPEDAEVRVYDAAGGFDRSVGGRGSGPGEFVIPGAAGAFGDSRDTVWVADGFQQRLTLFAADGSVIRTVAAPPLQYADTFTVSAPQVLLSSDRAVALAGYGRGHDDWTSGFPVLTYDPGAADGAIDEIARVDRTSAVQVRWRNDVLATGAHPFADAPLLAFHADGRVLIVERAGTLRLTAIDLAGDTLWTREYAYSPKPFDAAEVDSVLGARIRGFQDFARLEQRLTPDEAQQAYRASVRVPAHRPAVRTVIGAADGRTWLEWSAQPGEPVEWWILDGSGRATSRFTAPGALDARAADGDALWAVELDELDVPYVVRYQVTAR